MEKSQIHQPIARASNHLIQLQKEIKEEEEEIFAYIDSLIDSRSKLYTNLDEDDGDEDHIEDFLNRPFELHSFNGKARLETDRTRQDDQVQCHNQQNERHRIETLPISEPELEPEGQIQDSSCEPILDPQEGSYSDDHQTDSYPDDYGYGNYNEAEQNDYENIQAIIKQMTSNLPKPCVFFLEGNCRRSDCRYSHDLSNIPCKYWIEGFCFKGEMCPFLHSYNVPSDGQDQEDDTTSKKQLDPTFVIDSEADFPSLALDLQSCRQQVYQVKQLKKKKK